MTIYEKDLKYIESIKEKEVLFDMEIWGNVGEWFWAFFFGGLIAVTLCLLFYYWVRIMAGATKALVESEEEGDEEENLKFWFWFRDLLAGDFYDH